MSDQPPETSRPLALQAVAAIWRNKWMRILLIVFVAFEVYNTAILPALRGTYDTMRARDDARSAKAEADAKTAIAIDTTQIHIETAEDCKTGSIDEQLVCMKRLSIVTLQKLLKAKGLQITIEDPAMLCSKERSMSDQQSCLDRKLKPLQKERNRVLGKAADQ